MWCLIVRRWTATKAKRHQPCGYLAICSFSCNNDLFKQSRCVLIFIELWLETWHSNALYPVYCFLMRLLNNNNLFCYISSAEIWIFFLPALIRHLYTTDEMFYFLNLFCDLIHLMYILFTLLERSSALRLLFDHSINISVPMTRTNISIFRRKRRALWDSIH